MRRWEGGDLNFSYTKGRKLLMHSSGARRLEKRWPNADVRCGRDTKIGVPLYLPLARLG